MHLATGSCHLLVHLVGIELSPRGKGLHLLCQLFLATGEIGLAGKEGFEGSDRIAT